MKHYEERTTTGQYLARIDCDVCKKEIRPDLYEVADVDIKCDVGQRYPEGTTYVETSFDCCVECFKTKVRPAIEAIGVVFVEREVEF